MYQNGEFDDDCDILGWYTVDPQDADTTPVGIDQMERKVLEILKKSDNNIVPWHTRLKQVTEKNIAVKKARRQEIIDRAEQVAKDLQYMVGHNEESRMRRIMSDIGKEGMKDD